MSLSILYKYVKPDGLDIIKDLHIKVSNPKDFNDPFEFLPVIVEVTSQSFDIEREIFNNNDYLDRFYNYAISEGKMDKSYELFVEEIKSPKRRAGILKSIDNITSSLRTKCEEIKRKSDKIALVACFCEESIENHNEILMWSHYTDGHKGLRITFNADFLSSIRGSSLIKVDYDLNRVQLNPVDHFKGGAEKFNEVFDRVIRYKSSVWLYEKEYRWPVLSELCNRKERDSFISIDPLAIEEVVCGVRCPSEQILFIKDLVRSKLGDRVKVKKAEIDEYEFKLKYVEVV